MFGEPRRFSPVAAERWLATTSPSAGACQPSPQIPKVIGDQPQPSGVPRHHPLPGNLKQTVKADARAFGLRELAQCNLVNDSRKLAPRTSYLDFAEGAAIQLAGQFARVSDD